MSIAATHQRHHIHVPWVSVIAVAVAVAAAAGVLALVNQPTPATIGESTVAAPAVAAAVALPESPALRHQLADELATSGAQEEQFAYPRNHVVGVTLSQSGSVAAGGDRLEVPAAPNDPFPRNHFPGTP
jgi:hypothetical protein